MIKKCERLRDGVSGSWEQLQAAVSHQAQRLKSINGLNYSLVLGDLALDNLLLREGRLGVFDLEDIGVGDWRRDVACLIQRVSEAETNVYYSRGRVQYFQRRLLDEVGLAYNDPLLAIYRIEFYLDMLWSARQCQDSPDLPRPGFSNRKIEQMMERHLQSMVNS